MKHIWICGLFLILLDTVANLQPRQLAPPFRAKAVMPDLTFKDITLEDYRGRYVVLLFYPLDFTFVCPTQILAYDALAKQFEGHRSDAEISTTVLAISIDSPYTHLAWRNTPRQEGGLGTISLPLVSDLTKQVSRDYGVLVEDDSDALHGLSLRGLFIIDKNGRVRSMTMNDEQVGRNPQETLRLVRAFQHTDAHGVVCPASWTPGAATIIPDPRSAKEFFKTEL